MSCARCQWIAARDLDVLLENPTQELLALGGPYPETKIGWVRLVADLDPLAGKWLDWAFEAYRITPRIHAGDVVGDCLHPDAKFFSVVDDEISCQACRLIRDLEVVHPVPSLYDMGDLAGLHYVGPAGVVR